MTLFRRNNDVVIALCVRWDRSTLPLRPRLHYIKHTVYTGSAYLHISLVPGLGQPTLHTGMGGQIFSAVIKLHDFFPLVGSVIYRIKFYTNFILPLRFENCIIFCLQYTEFVICWQLNNNNLHLLKYAIPIISLVILFCNKSITLKIIFVLTVTSQFSCGFNFV